MYFTAMLNFIKGTFQISFDIIYFDFLPEILNKMDAKEMGGLPERFFKHL